MRRGCQLVVLAIVLIAPAVSAQWATSVLYDQGVDNSGNALGAADLQAAGIGQWEVLWLSFNPEVITDKDNWDVRVYLTHNSGHKKGDVAILICDNGKCEAGVVDEVSDAAGFGFVADFSRCEVWKKGNEIRIENHKKASTLPVDAAKILQPKDGAVGGKDMPGNPDDDCLMSTGVPALTREGLVTLASVLMALGYFVVRRKRSC